MHQNLYFFLHLSFVKSNSLCLIFSKLSGFWTTTETPAGNLNLARFISNKAILAFLTVRGIPIPPLEDYCVYQSITVLSVTLFPCVFKIFIFLTGYLWVVPTVILTFVIALTIISLKHLLSGPINLDDKEVSATFYNNSLSLESIWITQSSFKCLIASFKPILYPEITVVGCSLFLINWVALLNNWLLKLLLKLFHPRLLYLEFGLNLLNFGCRMFYWKKF